MRQRVAICGERLKADAYFWRDFVSALGTHLCLCLGGGAGRCVCFFLGSCSTGAYLTVMGGGRGICGVVVVGCFEGIGVTVATFSAGVKNGTGLCTSRFLCGCTVVLVLALTSGEGESAECEKCHKQNGKQNSSSHKILLLSVYIGFARVTIKGTCKNLVLV